MTDGETLKTAARYDRQVFLLGHGFTAVQEQPIRCSGLAVFLLRDRHRAVPSFVGARTQCASCCRAACQFSRLGEICYFTSMRCGACQSGCGLVLSKAACMARAAMLPPPLAVLRKSSDFRIILSSFVWATESRPAKSSRFASASVATREFRWFASLELEPRIT